MGRKVRTIAKRETEPKTQWGSTDWIPVECLKCEKIYYAHAKPGGFVARGILKPRFCNECLKILSYDTTQAHRIMYQKDPQYREYVKRLQRAAKRRNPRFRGGEYEKYYKDYYEHGKQEAEWVKKRNQLAKERRRDRKRREKERIALEEEKEQDKERHAREKQEHEKRLAQDRERMREKREREKKKAEKAS